MVVWDPDWFHIEPEENYPFLRRLRLERVVPSFWMINRIGRSMAYSNCRKDSLAAEISRIVSFTRTRRCSDDRRRGTSAELKHAKEKRSLKWNASLSRSPLAVDHARTLRSHGSKKLTESRARAASADIMLVPPAANSRKRQESLLRSLRLEMRVLSQQIQQLKGICDMKGRRLREDGKVGKLLGNSHELH